MILVGLGRGLLNFYTNVALIISFLAQFFELLHILAVHRKNDKDKVQDGNNLWGIRDVSTCT